MKHLILFLFIVNTIYGQNKILIPRTGTIVFVKEEKVVNKELYLKSYKELMPKMKKAMGEQIVMERLMEGKKTDAILLRSEVNKLANNMEIMLTLLLEEEKQVYKFYNEFNGEMITKYCTVDDLVKNKLIINQTTHEVTDESDEYADFEANEIIKLTECKNETKIINGYKCFKVVYSYNEPEQSDFDFLSQVTTNLRELWVTAEIKCNYHPVVNETEILEKYYPLEIIEYSDDIKGFLTSYKIETFNINQ